MAVVHCRDKDTGSGRFDKLIGMSPLEGRHYLTKTWPHPTICRLQCWDTSGQTTNRVGTQPHPLADKLLKVFLNKQLPNKHTS